MRSLSLIIVVSGLIIISLGCTSKSPGQKELRYVKVARVMSETTPTEKYFNAVVKENQQSSVAFRVGGPLENIYFEEGDYVKEGELLAQLDQRDFKNRLLAAEAQYKQAKGEYERYTQLFKQGKSPANTHDKMEAAWLSSKSNWENAKNALTDTKLKAPFTGFIFQKLANNHETVSPGQPILTLIDTAILEVQFGAPETCVNQLNEGQEVEVTINHHPNNRYPASITSINQKAGNGRLFEVRLKMKNPDPEIIKPGMTAKAYLKIARKKGYKNITTVPTESIFYSDNQAHVWIFNSNEHIVSKRSVNTGEITSNGMVEIVEGLNAGEMIVVAGIHSLMEGQPVKPLPQNASL